MSAFWHTVAVCLCILYMFMHFEKLWLFNKALSTGIFVNFEKTGKVLGTTGMKKSFEFYVF